MKITLAEIRLAIESGALQRLGEMRLPAKMSYWLDRICTQVEKEFEAIESSRIRLVKQHGAQDELGNFQVGKDNLTAFQTEYVGLLNETIDIKGEPFALDLFPKSAEISRNDMRVLRWLIISEDDAENVPSEQLKAASASA